MPDLPDAFHDALDHALNAVGLTLRPDARAAIEAHVRLLVAWNMHLNLTAIRDPAAIAIDHVVDSLAAIPLLHAVGAAELLDLGSGGGFPGLPIAVALPADRAVLVDSIAKKARFLRAAVRAMGLSETVDVATDRAEVLAGRAEHRERWPVVTARAVGTLADVAEVGLPLVATGGILVAWKRRPLDAELDAGSELIAALGGERPRIVDVGLPGRPDNVLVVVEKSRRTPSDYPREPAVRRRRVDRNDRRVR